MLLFGIFLSQAGAETEFSKKLKNCSTVHPGWPPKICESIALGKVEKEMTPEQIIAAWGPPLKVFDKMGEGGRYEYWHYPVKHADGRTEYTRRSRIVLMLKDRKLIEIH
jgi:hypothetical protein